MRSSKQRVTTNLLTLTLYTWIFLASSFLLGVVHGHRSLPSGITCGEQFSSPDTPLIIPNSEISWANYGIYTCDHPIQWYEVSNVEPTQELKFTVTVPVLERFQDVRMAVTILGPGLPQLPDSSNVPGTRAIIPDEIRQYATQNNVGGVIFLSPDTQSTCDHLTNMEMIVESSVKSGRCHFYEPFGDSNLWVVLDDILRVPATAGGTYKIAVYEQYGSTAKASFACCDWPEDFVTQYNIQDTECEVCGTDPTKNPAWLSLFYEEKTMINFGGYPPKQNCLVNSSPIPLPGGTKCPRFIDVDDNDSAGGNQAQNCNLGCTTDGECHSHNVYGECTHVLDWSLEPKFGNAPVKNVIIFKGDTIRFKSDDGDNLVHDLYQLVDDDRSYQECDFVGSKSLAGIEDISIGYDVTFDQPGTYYFTCSIGCGGTPSMSGNTAQTRQADGSSSSSCHCTMGQKLTVEVKDPTEGLQCHTHEVGSQHTHNGGSRRMASETASPLTCPAGMDNARIVNEPTYGAMNENECAEQCASPNAISFMTGVEVGSCVDLGYSYNAVTSTVRPPGSPVEIQVRVTTNNENRKPTGISSSSTCHCHSYEEIKCSGDDDKLYDEHIAEIEEYCQGILGGSEIDCPYKCYQPMEVLHLHYIECPSRPIHPTYAAIDATNMCHIAAAAPSGTNDCPEVELPVDTSNLEKDDDDDDKSWFADHGVDAIVVVVILGSIVFFFCYVNRTYSVDEAVHHMEKREEEDLAGDIAVTRHMESQSTM